MKRFVMAMGLGTALLGRPPEISAQDAANAPANTAAAQADRQDMEERYRRLNSAIDDLLAAEAQQRKRLADMAEEIQRLREELARAHNNAASYASVEDLKRLAKAVQDIDQKREQDKQIILDRIEDLKKLYKSAPPMPDLRPPRHEPPASDKSDDKPQGETKGYEHTVEAGESLSIIVQAYRKKGVKVTTEQVIKANPGLNPNRLIKGKKIFIPDPSLK